MIQVTPAGVAALARALAQVGRVETAVKLLNEHRDHGAMAPAWAAVAAAQAATDVRLALQTLGDMHSRGMASDARALEAALGPALEEGLHSDALAIANTLDAMGSGELSTEGQKMVKHALHVLRL